MCQPQAEVDWKVFWWGIDYLALGFKPKYIEVSSENSAKGLSKHKVTKSVVKAYELDNSLSGMLKSALQSLIRISAFSSLVNDSLAIRGKLKKLTLHSIYSSYWI